MKEIIDVLQKNKNILPLNCQFPEVISLNKSGGEKINKFLKSNKTGLYTQTQKPFKSVIRLF